LHLELYSRFLAMSGSSLSSLVRSDLAPAPSPVSFDIRSVSGRGDFIAHVLALSSRDAADCLARLVKPDALLLFSPSELRSLASHVHCTLPEGPDSLSSSLSEFLRRFPPSTVSADVEARVLAASADAYVQSGFPLDDLCVEILLRRFWAVLLADAHAEVSPWPMLS